MRARAEVGVPVGAGVELVARVVGVDEVDAPGDGPHLVDDGAEVVAAGVGVAGVEAEADVVAARRRPIASHSRPIASSRRAIALSPPAVFSMSSGTGRSRPSMHLRQLSKPVAASSSTPRWPPCTMTPLAPISAAAVRCCWSSLRPGDADAVVEARDVDRVGRVDVEVDARRLGVGLERLGARRHTGRPAPCSSAGRRGRTATATRRAPSPPRSGPPGRRAHRCVGP